MGHVCACSKNSKKSSNIDTTKKKQEGEEFSVEEFQQQEIIGKGSLGKVTKVICPRTKKFLAMKEISKLRVIEKKLHVSIFQERDILVSLFSPFITNLQYALQDDRKLYFMMDYAPGGDIRNFMQTFKNFTEHDLSLEYLHSNSVIHRDIKPENLVIDEKGYIQITDFGISTLNKDSEVILSSGTPCYMAPEVLLGKPYTSSIDFYALGIILYEVLFGLKPYTGNSKIEIKQKILDYQVKIFEMPTGFTNDCKEFINSLIQRKAENRLGFMGLDEIKSHKFFNNFDWEGVKEKNTPSPLLRFLNPKIKNFKNEDFSIWDKKIKIQDSNFENIFKKFLYFDREAFLEFVRRKQSQLSTQKTLNLHNIEKKVEVTINKEATHEKETSLKSKASDNEDRSENVSNNVIIVEEPANNESKNEVASQLSEKKSINISKISVNAQSGKGSLGSLVSLQQSDSIKFESKNDSRFNSDSEHSSIKKFKRRLTSHIKHTTIK